MTVLPPEPPSPEPPASETPTPDPSERGMFIAGIAAGCGLGAVAGVLGVIGLIAGQWAITALMVVDLVGGVLLFQWARRQRIRGFPQGLVVGLSCALLLLGACWGTVLVMSGS